MRFDLRMALLVAAFICELLATIGVPSSRYSLLAAGLACFFLSMLVT